MSLDLFRLSLFSVVVICHFLYKGMRAYVIQIIPGYLVALLLLRIGSFFFIIGVIYVCRNKS